MVVMVLMVEVILMGIVVLVGGVVLVEKVVLIEVTFRKGDFPCNHPKGLPLVSSRLLHEVL
jgi:hypothetical protein